MAAIYAIVPNFIKTGQTDAVIWRFSGFQSVGILPSYIFEIQIFNRSAWLRDPLYIIVPNFITFGQTVAEIFQFL